MRFAAAAVALAGTALAHKGSQSTVYSTEYYTITSCAPTVTDCPASSTVVSSSVVPLTTSTIYSTTTKTVTDCPDTVTYCPPTTSTGSGHYSNTTSAVVSPPYPTKTPGTTLTSAAPVCPGTSVKTISTSITTVIPTVIYETVQVPCPTASGPASSPSGYTPSGKPTGTKPPQPTFTAGAATLGGSAAFAAVAGLIALMA
ncbi:hypothetical protein N656DRAFT_565567 [Canariomyces notabilis]|uniref:GPI anchored serine-rich protein n=1 Tax=Canariomyces notabilis TaxID=2074819 RepID=A0AAN6YUA1_9PEZI|nr:hypothetical protein N656DRAFT_565567 [Canariomyces arenarius]